MPDTAKSVKELWRDYLFLTKEMAKFLAQNNLDMFNELMGQRERLQGLIDQSADDGFRSSQAGRQLLNAIRQEDANINNMLRLLYNKARHHQTVSNAYDSLGIDPGGARINMQR